MSQAVRRLRRLASSSSRSFRSDESGVTHKVFSRTQYGSSNSGKIARVSTSQPRLGRRAFPTRRLGCLKRCFVCPRPQGKTMSHFCGANSANNLSKRGSFRSGSQLGLVFRSPYVSRPHGILTTLLSCSKAKFGRLAQP